MQSHIRKVYACLAVTCHLHFWQNDRDLLRATVVTQGWNGYRNKSQHRKLTLEEKILPPFQQGFEPATFQSRVRRSNHWAIPVPRSGTYWSKPWYGISYWSIQYEISSMIMMLWCVHGIIWDIMGCTGIILSVPVCSDPVIQSPTVVTLRSTLYILQHDSVPYSDASSDHTFLQSLTSCFLFFTVCVCVCVCVCFCVRERMLCPCITPTHRLSTWSLWDNRRESVLSANHTV